MKYQVLWFKSALDELTQIWTLAPSQLRKAITAASHAVDAGLSDDPEEQGESRPNGRRVAFFPPLGVAFRVETQNRAVAVIHVWCFRQGSK